MLDAVHLQPFLTAARSGEGLKITSGVQALPPQLAADKKGVLTLDQSGMRDCQNSSVSSLRLMQS